MTPIKPSHATVDANHGQVDAERWDGLVPGDVGEAVSYPMANATSLHAFGTFGLSGVCDIEVSNDPQGKDETFVDVLTFRAPTLEALHPPAVWVRPRMLPAPDPSITVTVILLARRIP